LLSICIFFGCAPPPADDSTSTPSNEGSSKTSLDNSAFENVNLDNIIENNEAENLEIDNIPKGEFTLEGLKKALDEIEVSKGAKLTIYDDIQLIDDIDDYDHEPGKIEFTYVVIGKNGATLEETKTITLVEQDTDDTKDTENNNIEIVIYSLFESGAYKISDLKFKLKLLRVDEENSLAIAINGVAINDIDAFNYSPGSAIITLIAKDNDNRSTTKTIQVNVLSDDDTPTQPKETDISIYGIMAPGEYELATFKNNLKNIAASDNSTILLSLNGFTIYSIDSHNYPTGPVVLGIKATHPDGTVKSETVNISIKETTVTPPPVQTEITIYGTFSWGEYTIDDTKSKLRGIAASGGSQIQMTLNGSTIQSIDSHNYSVGPANLSIKATHPDGTTKTEAIGFSIKANPVDITIFGLFAPGTYNKTELIAKLKALSASHSSSIKIEVNGDRVSSIDSYNYPYSSVTLKITATHSTGSMKEANIDVTITKPPIELKVTYESTRIWTDAGSGADDDVAFYRPKVSDGYLIFGDKVHGSYSNSGFVLLGVKEGHEDIAHPVGYTRIWSDAGSGADQDGVVWRPTAPIGFTCLGDVMTNGPQPETDFVACVRNEHVENWSTVYKVWDDEGSGADSDFSGWQRTVNNDSYVDPATFIGNSSHSRPSISLFKVLKKSSVKYNN
jgi:hypothetical protein